MSAPIVITGVGKRIGYHLAKQFLAQDIPVVGTYRTAYPSIEELKELGAHLHCVDFYQQESLDAFIQSIQDSYPELRALLHNASDWLPEKASFSAEQIMNKMMMIHSQVPYQMNLALADLLNKDEQSSGDIIHFTDYVVEKGSKKHIAYAASKAATHNLTLSFASLLAPKVKVNNIAPALIKFNENDDDDYKVKALSKALLPIEGGYQSVIDTVEYILQSDYVTGRTFSLDGGRHLR